jgi:hypothetical protein
MGTTVGAPGPNALSGAKAGLLFSMELVAAAAGKAIVVTSAVAKISSKSCTPIVQEKNGIFRRRHRVPKEIVTTAAMALSDAGPDDAGYEKYGGGGPTDFAAVRGPLAIALPKYINACSGAAILGHQTQRAHQKEHCGHGHHRFYCTRGQQSSGPD